MQAVHQKVIFEVLQSKDKDVAMVDKNDENKKYFSMDAAWKDDTQTFLNNVIELEGDVKTAFRGKIKPGRGRLFTFSIILATVVEPSILLDETLLQLQRLDASVVKKQIQHLNTSRDIILLGFPLNLDEQGRTDLVTRMLAVGGQAMVSKHPKKYSNWLFGPTSVADWALYEDYPDNLPFVPREEGEEVPSWQRRCLVMECHRNNEDELYERLAYAQASGLMRLYLGENCFVVKNPGYNSSITDKNVFGRSVSSHGSFNMSVGRATLRDVVEVDSFHDLEKVDEDDDGNQVTKVIRRSLREIIIGIKVDHIRAFQVLCHDANGGIEAVYPNCVQGRATNMAGNFAGELRFYMQKRGVTEQSALRIIKSCFNATGYADALGAQLDRNENVINPRHAVMHRVIETIERCSWVDSTKGLTKHELREREAKEEARRPAVAPGNAHSFNFNERIVEDDAHSFSASVAMSSKSLAEDTIFEMERGNTVYNRVASSEAAKEEEEEWENFGEDDDWGDDKGGVAGILDLGILTTHDTDEDDYDMEDSEKGEHLGAAGGTLQGGGQIGTTSTDPDPETDLTKLDAAVADLKARLALVEAQRDEALRQEQEELLHDASVPEKGKQPVDETYTGLASATAVNAQGGAEKMLPFAKSAVQGGGASAVADHTVV